jgi:carboxymethylenebutenolidase
MSTVRFPSGVPIPTVMDASTDPYFKTRVSREALVEGLEFKPQVEGTYPGLVVLHEAWGLNAQIQEIARRLACEGYAVILPNLYSRQGGMVTADEEVAHALAARTKEADLLQDINSCCEFLNGQARVKQNIHGVIGFAMGGTLALRFACQRKRLRAAVAFYARITMPSSMLKNLVCPVLYHRAGADSSVTTEEIESLIQAGTDSGKPVEIKTYANAPPAFCNDTHKEHYRPDAAREAWETTVAFLATRLQA